MKHARIPVATLLATLIVIPTTRAGAEPPVHDRFAVRVQSLRPGVATRELTWQLANGGIDLDAWQQLAQCETENDWSNPGTFAGGLGIFTRGRFTPKHIQTGHAGTWERWGGEQFASTPAQASITEQIVVANRIAIFGWQTTFTLPAGWKGAPMTFDYKRPGIGVTGWGCAKTHPRIKRALCESGTAQVASWRRHCRRS